jgi:hypothetical protein
MPAMLTNDEAIAALRVAVTALALIRGEEDTFEQDIAAAALRIMDEKHGVSVEVESEKWGGHDDQDPEVPGVRPRMARRS